MDVASPFSFIALWMFVTAAAIVTALMEIQIEGGNGWAGCLPSWRFAPSWLKMFLNGKELTGYHVYLTIHSVLLFHLPFLLMPWSPYAEWTVLSAFFAYILVEDMAWFLLNPHFGWASFRSGGVSWYTRWFGPFPFEYYLALLISGAFAWLRGGAAGAGMDPLLATFAVQHQHVVGWLIGFGASVFLTMLTAILSAPRLAKLRAEDTGDHLGHPGVCSVCTVRMPKKVVETFVKQ